MFARFDLKYLDDPENVYGGAEQIHTVVRQDLEDDMPEATPFSTLSSGRLSRWAK